MNDIHALGLVLARSEGALLRLLGTVQRRGFEIAGLSTQPRDADTWIVLMQLSSVARCANAEAPSREALRRGRLPRHRNQPAPHAAAAVRGRRLSPPDPER